MKFKSLLLTAACGAIAFGAAAQSHHGYYMIPEIWDIDAYIDNQTKAEKTLNCWYTPSIVMPVPNADGTLPTSTIYSNNANDMIVRPTTMNDNTKNYYWQKLVGTSVDETITDDNFAKGYLEVTVPSKMDYPRTDPNTPNWVDITTDNGVMDFHVCLGPEPSRINDVENTLSATGDRAGLSDCTGAYVGIKAPAGCSVKVFMSTSSMSASTWKTDLGIDKDNHNPNLEGKVHTMAFDFDAQFNGNYQEITSGAPYGALTAMNFLTVKWTTGYCTKFIDVVVYGVKPGDVIGFGGLQTLHDGWTPQEFVEGWAGVETVGVDNSNAPVEYFNIQGMRVNGDNLTPGLYIKRQGTETAKVIVK